MPSDGGPIYCETDMGRAFVEPWSTVSEAGFLIVIIYWALRLRGRYRDHPFLAFALPVCFVGVVGGILYHGLRAHRIFFLMDIWPMLVLFVATVWYLFFRVSGRIWAATAYTVGFYFASEAIFRLVDDRITAIAISYAFAGLAMALPVLIEIQRNRGRGLGLVSLAGCAVAIGTVAHALDDDLCDVLPMGTLWIWHLLAAFAVHCLIRYLVLTPAPQRFGSRGR